MNQFTEEDPGLFFLDDFSGNARGGYYIRNNLKEFITRLNESGERVVGIKFDGSYNLEVLVEERPEFLDVSEK